MHLTSNHFIQVRIIAKKRLMALWSVVVTSSFKNQYRPHGAKRWTDGGETCYGCKRRCWPDQWRHTHYSRATHRLIVGLTRDGWRVSTLCWVGILTQAHWLTTRADHGQHSSHYIEQRAPRCRFIYATFALFTRDLDISRSRQSLQT